MTLRAAPIGPVQPCSLQSALCARLASEAADLSDALEKAELSKHVYDRYERESRPSAPKGWTALDFDTPEGPVALNNLLGTKHNPTEFKDIFAPTNSDFRAMAYKNEKTGEIVVAFRGTNSWFKKDTILPTDDAWANLKQGLGMQSQHYKKAVKLGEDFAVASEVSGFKLSFTGHSLGGGLASAAALTSAVPAKTFNAAGLHKNTVPGGDPSKWGKIVSRYIVEGDPLNSVQDNRDSILMGLTEITAKFLGLPAALVVAVVARDILPHSVGKRTDLPNAKLADGPHSMDSVLAGLKARGAAVKDSRRRNGCLVGPPAASANAKAK